MPIRVDIHAFGETVVLGRFIIRFSNIDAAIAKECRRRKAVALVLFFPTLFALFALFDTEKNKKRYSTDDTVAPDENQFKISRQETRFSHSVRLLSSFPFFVVAFLFSRRARLDGLLCFFFLYLSRKGGTFLF